VLKEAKYSSSTRTVPKEFCDVCHHAVYDLKKHEQTEEHKRGLRRAQGINDGRSVNNCERTVEVPQRRTKRVDKSVLTPRQTLVLSYLRDGYMAKEVAASLGRSIFTVKIMVRDLRHRLEARNTTQAVVIAIRKGLIKLGENKR